MGFFRSSALAVIVLTVLFITAYQIPASAEIIEWIGPNGLDSPWETGANWYSLDNGTYHAPTDSDTARLYNELGLGFTDSNVTVNSTTAICQKLQMKWKHTKLTLLTGSKLTTTGPVEMYQGDYSLLDIQPGATMDACTKTNTTMAPFRINSGSSANGNDMVMVSGTLNIVSLNPANGISDLQICTTGGNGTGTLNIYSTGEVNVDSYIIGSSNGTGRIYIAQGGVMTIAGDVTEQVNTDIVAGKISGVSVAIAANYNSGENKTYITAGGSIPAPPDAPASIAYPDSNSTGHYSVSWASSSGSILYQVERSGDGGSNWSQVYSGMSTSYSEIVTDGSYRYRVRAANCGGLSGWTTGSNDCVVVLVIPPQPPSSINYPSSSNSGEYSVSWAASTGAASYQLERSNNGGGIWNQIYTGSNISFAEDVNNGSYRYRVKASNSAGGSSWTTGTYDCVVFIPQVSMYFSAGTAAGWNFYDIAANIAGGDNVDWSDLNVLAQHWLNTGCGTGNNWCGKADIDKGNDVDFGDYSRLANKWNSEAAGNVLLQTIYGTAQDSSGNITANAYRALQQGKGIAMAFKVTENTSLDRGIFKCFTNYTPGWRAGQILRTRLFNVTGRGYLNYNHSGITRAEPGGNGNGSIFDYTLVTPESVPYHNETDAPTRQYADLIISFGGLPITAGEYFITFDRLDGPASITWGSFVCSYQIDPPPFMGKYPDGAALPRGATVTTSAATGNTCYYQFYDSGSTTYDPFSYMFAFQITTIN